MKFNELYSIVNKFYNSIIEVSLVDCLRERIECQTFQ